jgi:hypothetical protein
VEEENQEGAIRNHSFKDCRRWQRGQLEGIPDITGERVSGIITVRVTKLINMP